MQIVEKRGGVRRIVEHVGSAHDELELAVLMQAAREALNAGQDELDLGLGERSRPVSSARVLSTSSRILWEVLTDRHPPAEIGAGQVHFALVPEELHAQGKRLVAELKETSIRLTF